MVQLANQELFTGTPEDDVVSGTGAGDYLFGSDGNDVLSGLGGSDILRGSFGADELYGGDSGDGLEGGPGDDQLLGEDGDDNLRGAGGRDRLDGGVGNDVLSGGYDQDTLIGGAGGDLFVYDETRDSATAAADRIQDFAPEDQIDLSSIDASTGALAGQTFNFIGAGLFTGEGQIRAVAVGGSTLVEINTSGTGGAELVIELTNGAAVTAANFVLTGNPTDDQSSDDVILGDGGNFSDPAAPRVNDVLSGGAGEDYVHGGAGNDTLHGGADDDIVRGGSGQRHTPRRRRPRCPRLRHRQRKRLWG